MNEAKRRDNNDKKMMGNWDVILYGGTAVQVPLICWSQ